MGSCPVCLKNLMEEYAEPLQPQLTNYQKRRQALFPRSTTKRPLGGPFGNKNPLIIPEDQVVVSTKCGHLFHKLCLKDYIITFRQLTRQTFVECPICQDRIILSSTLVVHLRANDGCTEKTDRELKHAQIMHRELTSQVQDVQKKIAVVDGDIQSAMITLESLQIQHSTIHDQWSTKHSILKEFDDTKNAIEKRKEEREILRTENVELTSIYLSLVTENPEKREGPKVVPKLLRPHLKVIRSNRSLLKKFLQVIAPLRPTPDRNGNLDPVQQKEEIVLEILKKIRKISPELPEPEPEYDTRFEDASQLDAESELCEGSQNFEESQSQIYEESEIYDGSQLSEPFAESEQTGELDVTSDENSIESVEHSAVEQPPPRNVQRSTNNYVPGVQTMSSVKIPENINERSEESEESLPPQQQLKKQRKLRSKMTEKRDIPCKEKGPTKANKCRSNVSADTIILSPGKDYSKLVKSKISEIIVDENENMSELYRKTEFEGIESDLEEDIGEDDEILAEEISDSKLDVLVHQSDSDLDDPPCKVPSQPILKLRSGPQPQQSDGEVCCKEQQRQPSIPTFDSPENEQSLKRTVSRGSQMSEDFLFHRQVSTLKLKMEETEDLPTCESDPVSQMPAKVSTFRFSNTRVFAEPKIPTFTCSEPEPRVPTFKCSEPESRVPTIKSCDPEPRVPTFRSCDPEPRVPTFRCPIPGPDSSQKALRLSSSEKPATDSFKVPTFKAGTRGESNHSFSSDSSRNISMRGSVVPYSSSSSSSSSDDDSASSGSKYFTTKPKKTKSSGFEINHLSIVDYFNRRPTTQFSLESLSSLSSYSRATEIAEETEHDLSSNMEEDSNVLVDDKVSGVTVNRQESQCFTPSIYSDDEFYPESEMDANNNCRPDTPIPFVNSAYMLDLTDFPPAEELIAKFTFPTSEIPPPMNEDAKEANPVAVPISSTDVPPLDRYTGKIPSPRAELETTCSVVSQHILEPHCIENRNREESESEVHKCYPKNVELMEVNANGEDAATEKSMDVHPTFSEELAAIIVPPPPQYCLDTTLRDVMSSRITLPVSARPSGFGEPPDQSINSQPSKTISIFDWLPEASENRDKPFLAHAEIAPEVALIIQSRQAYQLSQQAQRTILKIKKTRRRNV